MLSFIFFGIIHGRYVIIPNFYYLFLHQVRNCHEPKSLSYWVKIENTCMALYYTSNKRLTDQTLDNLVLEAVIPCQRNLSSSVQPLPKGWPSFSLGSLSKRALLFVPKTANQCLPQVPQLEMPSRTCHPLAYSSS